MVKGRARRRSVSTKGARMGEHDLHECDTHEHHGDEEGHVHDPHECDTHEHHGH